MKVKITSANRTQQVNVIAKCRSWGAGSRDGDYGPVDGKTAVVVNTKLGGGTPALQISRVDFTPTKSPYDLVLSYKDFMNADICPWDSRAPLNDDFDNLGVQEDVGVCAQETLVVSDCTIITQEDIAWKTLGLPFLQDNGVDVTIADGIAYIINTKQNTAKPLTSKTAAKKAKKDIIAGIDSPWALFARHFDLVETAVLIKEVDED